MKNLNIDLIKQEPHKVYRANIEYDFHITSLCKFLRKQKDRKIELVLNGKSIKFNSIAGIKRFAAGFEQASKIIEQYTKEVFDSVNEQIEQAKREAQQDIYNQYRIKKETMDIQTAAWKDRIAELEEDRKILKQELDRLRNERSV